MLIQLIDVHKSIGGKTILDGVSLSVEPGENVVIIGRSGTGKTVTLKHITGLMRPDSGRVMVDGTDVTNARPAQLRQVRRRLGVLFQSGALINWMSVLDNVALPLRELSDMAEEEIRAAAEEKLALVDLADAGHLMPDSLSGGMRKRAGLARALVREPEIMLYDEPTSGLDPVTANHINQLILDMQHKLDITSVVVTHDMQSAFMIADRIAMLHEGRVIQTGTPQEIQQTDDPVVRQFITGDTEGPVGAGS